MTYGLVLLISHVSTPLTHLSLLIIPVTSHAEHEWLRRGVLIVGLIVPHGRAKILRHNRPFLGPLRVLRVEVNKILASVLSIFEFLII